MRQTKIYLLDDHKMMRDGLKSILNLYPEFKVIGEESSPSVFLENFDSLDFDLLILDISLPNISGLEVLKHMKDKKNDVSVVILSMHDSPEYMIKSFKLGANAYLSKDMDAEVLVSAIKEVIKNGSYFPTKMSMGKNQTITDTKDSDSPANSLTVKEKEVLRAMTKGLSSKQIASDFGLSSRTIEAHRLNIMKKLGTSNSAETIAIALKLNLI